jgi:hypothetical protein
MIVSMEENPYVMKYRKLRRYKYQLMEDYIFNTVIITGAYAKTDFILLTTKGHLHIKKYYAWDGPSGPTINTKSFMRGSLVHDALYQLIRLNLLSKDWKPHADFLLHKICLEDGMLPFRAKYVYQAVTYFGSPALVYDPKETTILTIP